MPNQERPVRRCDHCGKWDDHPRVVFAREDWGDKHHDCLSVVEAEMVARSSEHGAAIIEAAKSGVHGDKLLAYIEKLHAKKGGKS